MGYIGIEGEGGDKKHGIHRGICLNRIVYAHNASYGRVVVMLVDNY